MAVCNYFLPENLVAVLNEDDNQAKFVNCDKREALKYLKGLFSSRERFNLKFYNKIKDVDNLREISEFFDKNFDEAKPFTYREAFEIKNNEFKALVFGSVDITEMIDNLGKKKLKVDGIPVKRKQFDDNGNFLGYKEYDNIYETYEVDGNKLGVEENLYVIKCWCTSTNKEHWIWIEEKYKDDPLSAIASTFRIHNNLIPHIKELKRQGDVMLVELNEEVKPEGDIVPLTKDQYFGLLTSES